MRITNFNCAPLQWTRARSTIHLSGYAAGQQNSRLALTGLLIRADVHTTCHASRVAPWKDDNLTTPKLFCRAGSTHITKSTASTLPTTLPENATVTEVARFLRAHREDIEASRKSAAGRRELARTRNIGLQALVWVQELDGLDEQHVIPKDFCNDLGWLIVADGNEKLMISWLVVEGLRWKSSQKWVNITRANYRDVGAHGNRTRRRHDQLAGLISGHVQLSVDGTVDDAIKCLRVVVTYLRRFDIENTVGIAGTNMALNRATTSDTLRPGSAPLFDWYMGYLALIPDNGFRESKVVQTKLYHPTAPDPWEAYHNMRSTLSDLLKSKHKIDQAHWNKEGFFLLRLMFILHLEGAVAESNAVSEVLQENFVSVWRRRHPAIARYQQDPKLEQLRAQHRNAVNGGRRPQHDTLEPQPNKLPENVAASDDLLDESGPGIEEPNYDVSSELLELRSRRRR
jgi:hypothetical protein